MSDTFNNWREVDVGGEKRIMLKPKIGADYYLGCYNLPGVAQEVSAIYFGFSNGNHFFYNLNPNGKVERYISEGVCFMSYISEGDDGPEIPFIFASFQEFLGPSKEKEFIAQRIERIREGEKRSLDLRIREIINPKK